LLEDAREPQGMMQHYITAYCADSRRHASRGSLMRNEWIVAQEECIVSASL
jgi:hypothetical protein